MPIFIPKNISYTPDSLKKFDPVEDDPEDFIQDPEQFTDDLPQPYRMLDKFVNIIVEDAWNIITTREAERLVQASKIMPPKYSTDIQIEVHGPCKSICTSPSGDIIFLGKPDGLAVLNAETQETIDEWKDTKMDIVNVEAVSAEEGNCLVCTIDDLGVGRLFLYSEKTLYLMFGFNEPIEHDEGNGVPADATSKSQPPRSAQKPIITKCQPSSNGDYIGVCFESVQTQENWLDVFKITKETLLKELETAYNRYAKKTTADTQQEEPNEVGSEVAAADGEPTADTARTENQEQDGVERTDEVEGESLVQEGKQKSQLSQKSQPDKKSARFTAPQLVLKIKPQQPLHPCNFGSPFAAQSSADATGDILGSGIKHQLSSHHMGMKLSVFEHLHEQFMKYAPKNEPPALKQPSFHFLNAGKLLPIGLDQAVLQGQPTAMLVWWEDSYQVCFYPLTKIAKDVEHKPELLWPMSDSVQYSTVSKDNSLVAFGLRNKNVVIWDVLLGMPRKTVHLTDTGNFFKLQFLDPNIYEGTGKEPPLNNEKPYTLATNCYLLAVIDDGQNFIVTCGLNDETPPKQTSPVLQDWEKYTIMEPLPNLPELAVTMRKNGQAFIEDILTGEILLSIAFPPPFKIFMPWQPVFALGRGGSILYVRGNYAQQKAQALLQVEKEAEEPQQVNSLFVFKLRSFRTLDKYRKKTRRTDNTYAVHSQIKDRVNTLMKDRISQQAGRQARMQQRWSQLKEELELIQELRGGGFGKNVTRVFSESTIARTPALELQRDVD